MYAGDLQDVYGRVDLMNINETIKSQSGNALKDNRIAATAGFLLLAAAISFVYIVFLIIGTAGDIWEENGAVKAGNDIYFMIMMCICVLTAIAVSPFKNGFMKLCYNIAKGNKGDVSDMFYFFKRNKYLNTIEFNLILTLKILLRIAIGLIPYFAVKVLTYFFSVQLLTTVTANDIFEIISAVLFVLGCIAGLILSVKLFADEFAYIEYEDNFETVFKASKTIKKKYSKSYYALFFSFVPWVLLSLLVIPAIYVLPYLTTAFANSSKWLILLYKEGKMV